MNKIIILPGHANGVFFLNELNFIKKYFDEVVVITYPGNKKEYDEISKARGFKYKIVDNNILKTIFDINFYKLIFRKESKIEIAKYFNLTKIGLLRLGYILYYGQFYVNAKRIIDYEVNLSCDDNIILYSFWFSRGAYTIANYNLKRNSNIKKIISRAHRYDLYEDRNKSNYLPFRDFINNNLDELHFISEHGLQYYLNKQENSAQIVKCLISRLGTFNIDRISKKCHLKKQICIASCSAIIPVKRLDLIIDVMSKINIPFTWIHIGTGTDSNKIESYAREKLSSGEFNFLGHIDNSNILKVYEKYDVDFFINMSDSEGIPVTIIEAMSMGIPVIARNVGGTNEIVNAETGVLINDVENMDSVMDTINKEVQSRVTDITGYEIKSSACINMWNTNYNAFKNYDDFFKRLLN